MFDKKVNQFAPTIVDAVDGEPETEPTKPSEEDVVRTDKFSTGFTRLDRAINGLPRQECFVALASKHDHGKAAFLDSLTIGLLQNNPETIVFLHMIDDTLGVRIPRLLGAKFNYPSDYFKRSGYWLKHLDRLPARYRHFDEIYAQAQAWLRNLLSTERLILADVAGLSPQLPALEMWVRSIRAKWPNRSLVVIGDNFHLYDIPGIEPGEAKIREMSTFVKRLTTEQHCTVLMPVPPSNARSRTGDGPRIAGGGKAPVAARNSSATSSIYNVLKDLGDRGTLVWYDIDAEQEAVDVEGQETPRHH